MDAWLICVRHLLWSSAIHMSYSIDLPNGGPTCIGRKKIHLPKRTIDEGIIIATRPPHYNAVQRRWRRRRARACRVTGKKMWPPPPLLHAYDERDGPAEITRFGPVITGGKQRVLYDHGNLPSAAAVTVVKREITSQMTCSTCVALT